MTTNTRRAAYLTKHLQSWAAFFTHDEWMHTLRDLPMADAIEAVLGAAPAWVEPNPLPRRTYNLFTFAPLLDDALDLNDPAVNALADRCYNLFEAYKCRQDETRLAAAAYVEREQAALAH